MRRWRILLAIVLCLAISPASLLRAEDYPARAVTIVNPFAPGGGTDLLARMVGQKLEQRLGQSFVIENKTGAGSIIAATHVQKSNPDGYTLLMAPTPTMAVNVSLYKSLPYEPLTDFVPLALLAQTPFVLIVHPDLPVKSVAELIAYSKANPGKLTFASVGPGVPHHLYMEMLKGMTGIQASYVPYRGSLPALNDVVAGHVPMMFVDFGPGNRRAAIGQGPSARRNVENPRARIPRYPAAQRGRRAGFRGGGLADARCAGQDTAPGHRPAASRTRCHPGATGHQGSDRQVRLPAGGEQVGREAASLCEVGNCKVGQGGARRRYRRLAITLKCSASDGGARTEV
jgi:hypothetical protein